LASAGANVKFRSNSEKHKVYRGVIDTEREKKFSSPTAQNQSPPVEVRFIISNDDKILLIGERGYAWIDSEDMFLFQRIHWEISRLISTRFWW
jgi:hypothetical protein